MRQLVAGMLQVLDALPLLIDVRDVAERLLQQLRCADDVCRLLVEELIEAPLARDEARRRRSAPESRQRERVVQREWQKHGGGESY